MEMLSEHTVEGMLEGYLLTGRHGFISSYEAFIHVIDSMFNQFAKWLSICNNLSRRQDVASLNLLITSTVWRQDHNGFTHQDPGFLDVGSIKARALPASISRPTSIRCSRSRITACAARTTSTSSCQTSRCICNTWIWTPRFSTARRASTCGSGRVTTKAVSPTSSWLQPAIFPRRKRWQQLHCCGRSSPRSKSDLST